MRGSTHSTKHLTKAINLQTNDMKTPETTDIFDLIEIFDRQFKFQVGQTLRHKGDKKEYGMNDMGVLVLARIMSQEINGNSLTFHRTYHCRMIAMSGSGQIVNFKEHELQTIEEWQKNSVTQEVERNMMRNDVQRLEDDILRQFDLSKHDRFYLKDSTGNPDKEKEYRMNGFKANQESGKYEISVRQVNTLQTDVQSIYIYDKSQLEKITA